jgi:hypothetical protein
MTDVFVSSNETRVIGGTSTVNVELDFGPKGDRGSLFLVGYGNPNTVNHSEDLQLLDIYINIQTTDNDYLVVYQYVNVSGVETWVETGRLITDKFSTNRFVSFTDGVATDSIEFKISSIIPISLVGGLESENFNIQLTFADSENPIASSITVGVININPITNDLVLPISVNAAEYADGEWTPVNNTKNIHFLVTVV